MKRIVLINTSKPRMPSISATTQQVLSKQVYIGHSTLLKQLKLAGYDVSAVEGETPEVIQDKQDNEELGFEVTTNESENQVKKVKVHFHVSKILRTTNVFDQVSQLLKDESWNKTNDSLIIVAKDKPNDSIRSACIETFGNDEIYVIVLGLGELQFNVLDHSLVPKHEIMTDEEIKTELSYVNDKDPRPYLPEISRFDPVSQAMLLRPGQVCRIFRPSKNSGITKYYRHCI